MFILTVQHTNMNHENFGKLQFLQATEKSAEIKQAEDEYNKFSEQEQEKIEPGLKNIGFYIEEKKNNFFAGAADLALENIKDKKGTAGRFFTALSDTFKRDAKGARVNMEKIEKGEDKSVRNFMAFGGNILKYGRTVADVAGATIASPFRYVMTGSMMFARGSEAAKEARLKNEKVIEKTRMDINEAADEAWDIYGQAQTKTKDKDITKGDLETAYHEQLPQDVLKRLQKNPEPGVAGEIIQTVFKKHIKWSAQRIDNKIKKIESDKSLTAEEKKEKKNKIINKYSAQLKDFDRIVSKHGIIDTLAMAAKYSEKGAKTAVKAMMIESLGRMAANLVDGLAGSAEASEQGNSHNISQYSAAKAALATKELPAEEAEQSSEYTTLQSKEMTAPVMENNIPPISEIKISKEVEAIMKNRNIQLENGVLDIGNGNKIAFSGVGEDKGITKSVEILKKGNDLEIVVADTDGTVEKILLDADNNIIDQAGVEEIEAEKIKTEEVEVKADTETPAEEKSVEKVEKEEVVKEAAVESPKIITEVEVQGKTDTLSEAVEKALKQDGVPDKVKDNFIKQWILKDIDINDENRNDLLNKAIRKLSVANIKMGDGNDIQNLIYEGNKVQLNSDGSVEVTGGGGVDDAKVVSEAELRQNVEALKPKVAPVVDKTVSIESAAEAAPSDNLSTQEELDQITQAEAANRVEARMKEISEWKFGLLKGEQMDELIRVQNEPAENILSGDYEPADNQAGGTNLEELERYAREAKELIGAPQTTKEGVKETITEFTQRYETEIIKGAEELENEIFKTGDRNVYDLIKIPLGERSHIMQDYYQAIKGFDNTQDQANLIRVLHNPKNNEALAGLFGEYNEALFKGVEARLDQNGNLEISYDVKDNMADVDLKITKSGKMTGDGFGKNNWPSGTDVDNPTTPFTKDNLKKFISWLNKGKFSSSK